MIKALIAANKSERDKFKILLLKNNLEKRCRKW